MIKKIIGGLATSMVLLSGAQAASLALTPQSADPVDPGQQFFVDLLAIGFDNGFATGGMTISWDPSILQFDFYFSQVGEEAGITCGTFSSPACAFGDGAGQHSAAVGGFGGLGELPFIVESVGFPPMNTLVANPDFSPNFLLGTFGFTVLGGASEALTALTLVNQPQAGGWNGCAPDFDLADPCAAFAAYNVDELFAGGVSTTIDVNTAVIPLPAAVWFMIGGLGALAGFRRK